MRLLYDLPTPLIVAGLFLLMVLALEGAQRLGARFGAGSWAHARDVVVAIAGATLALLGLMLAFSFSMSVDRFEARRALLLHESNSIVRVDLYADLLLPEPRAQMRDLLRDYAGSRLSFLTVGHDPDREQAAIDASLATHARIWPLVIAMGNYREPQALSLSLLSHEVVEMAAVAREREVARALRVPEPVLLMLFALAVLSGAMVAYAFGASGHRGRPLIATFVLMVCMVVYIVIDLDRPRRGLMRLDPAPLEDALALVSRPG